MEILVQAFFTAKLIFCILQGLYYSYYKTIVKAPTFTDGLRSVVSCNVTEYPSKVNVLRRFNLYPEVRCQGVVFHTSFGFQVKYL